MHQNRMHLEQVSFNSQLQSIESIPSTVASLIHKYESCVFHTNHVARIICRIYLMLRQKLQQCYKIEVPLLYIIIIYKTRVRKTDLFSTDIILYNVKSK